MVKKKQKESKRRAKILVVDDHPIVRQGLTQLINQEPDLKVCGEEEKSHKALDSIKELMPDMAIVDITLKESSGIDLIKSIKKRYTNLPVLVLSMHDESLYAERVMKAGARGYIMKREAAETLVDAIRKVLNGEKYLSPAMKEKMLDKFIDGTPISGGSPAELLSDRELEVFKLIGQGLGMRQIARELYLSVKTVETYREHIKVKLKIESADELRQQAIKLVQTWNLD